MTLHAMAQRIEHWLIEKLIPYARNPRTHSDAQVAQIAASIADGSRFQAQVPIDDFAIAAGAFSALLAPVRNDRRQFW
jgi:hypothetical protein